MADANRKGMATSATIRKHWAEWLVEQGKFDSVEEVLEGNYCFACGFEDVDPIERAHIVALADGGPNSADNLHNLCRFCHKASELLSGDSYFEWFRNRNVWHRQLEIFMRNQAGGATRLFDMMQASGVQGLLGGVL